MKSKEASTSTGAEQNGLKRKRTMARHKIPIERIQNKDARQVTFSKRRQGLFKKAHKLSVLTGAHVSVIVFSPASRPYSFTHPSNSLSVPNQHVSNSQENLNQQASELEAMLAAGKRKNTYLKKGVDGSQGICSADVETMSLDELKMVEQRLSQVTASTAARDNQQRVTSGTVPAMYGYGYGNGCYGEQMIVRDAFGRAVAQPSTSSIMEMYQPAAVASPGYVNPSHDMLL